LNIARKANVEPDIELTRARLSRAFDDYREDRVELISDSLVGATHLAATRKGLYALNETEWSHIVPGFFFGLTIRGDEIFAFEACGHPYIHLNFGRIVRLRREGDRVVNTEVLAKGLDNGCHQIDLCAGLLHVVDTYHQQIVRLGLEDGSRDVISPFPVLPPGDWDDHDLRYVHANSVLRVGYRFLVLLHNTSEHTARLSEVAIFDSAWNPIERWALAGRGCHGLALLEDGTLLTCDSMAGDVISAQGMRVSVSPYLTRGLAVGAEGLAVGASFLARREERVDSGGTVTFLDRDYRKRSVLALPGAPMELRRLDGEDYGMSSFLERANWGRHLKPGSPVA